MKKIVLIVALALAAAAHAGDRIIATLPNKAGGQILLLNVPCASRDGGLATTYVPSGDATNGCWSYDDEAKVVVVKWETGEVKVFNSTDFNVVGLPARRALAKRQGVSL